MNSEPTTDDLMYDTWATLRAQTPDRLTRLALLEDMRQWLEGETRFQVDAARREGASWSDIGAQFRISKQGAQKRFTA